VNTPLRFSTDRFEPFRAPSMGEHSHAIAREICGLGEEAIAGLHEQGVFK
jgi:crotonobetainyl-CoA:carnitine CoA-transferase CaiB-like acyl-CoA transferase